MIIIAKIITVVLEKIHISNYPPPMAARTSSSKLAQTLVCPAILPGLFDNNTTESHGGDEVFVHARLRAPIKNYGSPNLNDDNDDDVVFTNTKRKLRFDDVSDDRAWLLNVSRKLLFEDDESTVFQAPPFIDSEAFVKTPRHGDPMNQATPGDEVFVHAIARPCLDTSSATMVHERSTSPLQIDNVDNVKRRLQFDNIC